MTKRLEGLKYSPKWVTHLGCVKGCLDYLNINVSDAWLFGATGHAFVINLHEVVCPSGPTAWKTEMLFMLGRNVGYTIDGVFSHKSASDFAEKQKNAWEMVKKSLDADYPCYGWELGIPEFYVVFGYDVKGYYYRDFDNSGKGPKPWNELGDTGIGVLEMYCLKPGEPADDATAVKEALEFALEISESPPKWIFPKYKAGVAGFDNWIRALETGEADGFGNAYSAVVWNECRGFAVEFLKEAKQRIGGDVCSLFDEAIGHYSTVSENLASLAKIFPFKGPNTKGEEVKEKERVRNGLKHLRTARNAEESGLRTLEKISSRL